MDPELARTEGQGRARPSETFLPGFEGRDIEASGARIHLARGGAGRPPCGCTALSKPTPPCTKKPPPGAGASAGAPPGCTAAATPPNPEGAEGLVKATKPAGRPI